MGASSTRRKCPFCKNEIIPERTPSGNLRCPLCHNTGTLVQPPSAPAPPAAPAPNPARDLAARYAPPPADFEEVAAAEGNEEASDADFEEVREPTPEYASPQREYATAPASYTPAPPRAYAQAPPAWPPAAQSAYAPPAPAYAMPPPQPGHAPPGTNFYNAPAGPKPVTQGVAVAGLLLNILIWPGLGSLVAGRQIGWAQGFLFLFGIILTITLVGAIVGIPLMIGMWVWALVTGIQLVQGPKAPAPYG